LARDLDLFIKNSDFIGVDGEGDSVAVGVKNEARRASVGDEGFGDGSWRLVGFLDEESLVLVVEVEFHKGIFRELGSKTLDEDPNGDRIW
jgi:hypothetical protein